MFQKIEDINLKPIREIVLNELRNAIFDNRLKPGDRLIEISIASSMGVSRTPVREALRQLEIEGLATNLPRKGTIVVGITIDDAIEIYDLREVLEGLAARNACLNISRLEIRRLKEIISFMEDNIENKDAIETVHREFNDIILNASRNKRLKLQLEHSYEYLQSLIKVSLDGLDERLTSLEEHKRIVLAIEQGDEYLAEKEARNHILNAKKRFLLNYKYQIVDTI